MSLKGDATTAIQSWLRGRRTRRPCIEYRRQSENMCVQNVLCIQGVITVELYRREIGSDSGAEFNEILH